MRGVCSSNIQWGKGCITSYIFWLLARNIIIFLKFHGSGVRTVLRRQVRAHFVLQFFSTLFLFSLLMFLVNCLFTWRAMGSGHKVQLQQVKINREVLNSCRSRRFTGELSLNWWLTVVDFTRQEHKYLQQMLSAGFRNKLRTVYSLKASFAKSQQETQHSCHRVWFTREIHNLCLSFLASNVKLNALTRRCLRCICLKSLSCVNLNSMLPKAKKALELHLQ